VRQPDDDPDSDVQRRRRYNLGALAQSYPPKGVASLLQRPESRPAWGERPLRERVGIIAVLAVEAALAGVLIAGVAARSAALVLAASGVFLVLLLGTAAVTVRPEQRRSTAADNRKRRV
jgi:hypothetical protein